MNLKGMIWLRKIIYVWRNWRNKHSYTSGKNNKIISGATILGDGEVAMILDANALI